MAYNTGTDPTLAELISRYFVPSVYSKKSLMHTKSNLISKECFNTDYQADLKLGATVYIPVFVEGSTNEVTPGTEPTAQDGSTTGKSITIDQWRESTREISELADVEKFADYLDGATKSASYSIAKYIDTTVTALFPSLYSSSVYGVDGQDFTDEMFRALVRNLDEGDVPDEDRCLIGDPSMKEDLLDIDKFISVDYTKSTVVPAGMFGTIYNSKVYITNNLTAATTGNYGVYAHKDAIGIVVQKNPRVRAHDMSYKFITKVIVDAAWGVAELRDTFGRAFYTKAS